MAETAPSTVTAPAAPAATAAETTPGTGAPASTGNGGAPGNQGGAPTFASDKERADHYEARHREATDTIRRTGETVAQHEARLAKYREAFGELEPETAPTKVPATQGGNQPDVQALIDQSLNAREIDQQIGRTPTLIPHAKEIKDLMTGGATLDEARKTIAERHNITLGPIPGPMDLMPSMPGGGTMPAATGFSTEHVEQMQREGIDPEKAKKHLPKLNEILGKAKRR